MQMYDAMTQTLVQTLWEPEVLRASDIILDRGTYEVLVSGRLVQLTRSEFNLLAALMSEPGRAFSRPDLLRHMTGESYDGYERTIDVHIRHLRTKIEPAPHHPRYVKTVYGVGYRFDRLKNPIISEPILYI
jgi:DNA-binding response OmpR family regulator